jgi:probable F420-dependent oxidoreductase
MRIDASIGGRFIEAADQARRYEADGYDGVWATEAAHDPFLPLALVATETSRVQLGTAIAVAFAHSPLSVAQMAHDLQVESGGRFVLGLGSQIKAHITRRYSLAWGQPAARMREFVLALHAIWSSWNEGTALDFRGDFFTHTLMTPFFSPAPSPAGRPPVFLAGVNTVMTEVAGEVADGFLAHPFTTERYLREVTLPALVRGQHRRDGGPADLEVSLPVLIVTGETEEAYSLSKQVAQRQIAFYASTAAYRPVLAAHGWEDLQTQLARLAREDRWDQMSSLVDDEVLATFAVVGEPAGLAGAITARFGGAVQRVSIYQPREADAATISSIVSELQANRRASGASGTNPLASGGG